MTRTWIVAGAAVAALVATAPAMAASETYDWTGAYAGVHVGYGWGHEHWNQTSSSLGLALDQSANAVEPNGVIGGIQLGYDHQSGALVLGLAADGTWTDQKHASDHVVFPSYAGESNIDWTGTLTARAGYAVQSTLFYVDGGGAIAREQTFIMFTGAQTTNTDTQIRTGWTVGGGVETALWANWTAGLEYGYTDYGTSKAVYTYSAHPAGLIEDWNLDTHNQQVKLKFNYRFR